MTMSGAFWSVVNSLTPATLSTQISNIQAFNNTELAGAIDTFNTYLDKVYYFIPQELLTPLLVVVGSIIFIRIVLAIVNLIWW